MKTEIINDSKPSAAAPVEYPALYRGHDSGNLWLQVSRDKSVCLALGETNDGWVVGDIDDRPIHKLSGRHTRITTPITIKFTP